jgi:hypothetical protein
VTIDSVRISATPKYKNHVKNATYVIMQDRLALMVNEDPQEVYVSVMVKKSMLWMKRTRILVPRRMMEMLFLQTRSLICEFLCFAA